MSIPQTATTWQISIDTPGAVVTELESVAQSVRILLETEPGSDPLRPEFGVGLVGLVGRPIAEASMLLRRRGKQQFEDYLPDVTVTNWRVTADESDPGSIVATIFWSWNGGSYTTTATA